MHSGSRREGRMVDIACAVFVHIGHDGATAAATAASTTAAAVAAQPREPLSVLLLICTFVL